MQKSNGFTLVELMIVVAIIGIIAAFAFPSYQRYMLESRRADAQVLLTSASNLQERTLTRTGNYTETIAQLNPTGNLSEQGFYNFWVAFNDSDTTAAGSRAVTVAIANPAGGGNLVPSIDLTDRCVGARCYVLAATPAAGSPQLADEDCAVIVLDSLGRRFSFNRNNVQNAAGTCW